MKWEGKSSLLRTSYKVSMTNIYIIYKFLQAPTKVQDTAIIFPPFSCLNTVIKKLQWLVEESQGTQGQAGENYSTLPFWWLAGGLYGALARATNKRKTQHHSHTTGKRFTTRDSTRGKIDSVSFRFTRTRTKVNNGSIRM